MITIKLTALATASVLPSSIFFEASVFQIKNTSTANKMVFQMVHGRVLVLALYILCSLRDFTVYANLADWDFEEQFDTYDLDQVCASCGSVE